MRPSSRRPPSVARGPAGYVSVPPPSLRAAKRNAAGGFDVLDVVVAPVGGPLAGARKGIPAEILPPGAVDPNGPVETISCEIHYYDAAALPTPHILDVAHASGAVAQLAATPLVLNSPEGVNAAIGVAQGALWVTVNAGTQFLASGSYLVTAHLATDLQVPMAPFAKDGITYDRVFIGCRLSGAP